MTTNGIHVQYIQYLVDFNGTEVASMFLHLCTFSTCEFDLSPVVTINLALYVSYISL